MVQELGIYESFAFEWYRICCFVLMVAYGRWLYMLVPFILLKGKLLRTQIMWKETILGVANGTSKNVGLGKFWQDLEISEAFLISLVFAWFVFTFFESRNFLPKSLGLGFLTRISASRRVSDFTIRHP